jgi:hypothetical protein
LLQKPYPDAYDQEKIHAKVTESKDAVWGAIEKHSTVQRQQFLTKQNFWNKCINVWNGFVKLVVISASSLAISRAQTVSILQNVFPELTPQELRRRASQLELK